MKERRVAPQGIKGIGHGRQLGVIHLYQRGNLVQLIFLICGDDSQHIAHIPGDIALPHHHIPVLLDVADIIARHIRLGQHPHAVRVGLSVADINVLNAGAGIAGIDAAGIKHSVHRDVVGKNAAAVDLLRRVDTLGMFIHAQCFGGRRNRLFLPEELRRHQNGILNLLVAGAAAEIAPDGLLHIGAGGGKIRVQQAFGGDDHAGNAEAALHRARLGKAMLINAHFRGGNTLDG